MALRTLSAALALAVSLTAADAVDVQTDAAMAPSIDVARQRGPAIFNAVHDAMRQWGSSLHHNGMSFFLATVPEGVTLHHGSSDKASPTQPEWLAYEIEHAENFARPRRWPGRTGAPRDLGAPRDPGGPGGPQHVLRPDEADIQSDDTDAGWLHIYRTVRPLHYLYIDGMGAGKTNMGTLDSQDYVLRGVSPEATVETAGKDDEKSGPPSSGGPMDEQQRATDLCDLVTPWGLQGVIRMEAGFEIIQCDFADGLEQVQVLRRPSRGGGDPGSRPNGPGGLGNVEFLRGLSERYQGIGSHRTRVDYASMVSAYFFPLNLTNPDSRRPDLARLLSASTTDLAAVRTELAAVVTNRSDSSISAAAAAALRPIDWQDVTDMIVSRYADRLSYMAAEVTTVALMAREADFLLDVYIDYEEEEEAKRVGDAIGRCTHFYLGTVAPTTTSDRLVHAALVAVMNDICTALFDVRDLVREAAAAEMMLDADVALADSIAALQSLVAHLGWARFKRCPACGLGEVCAIPMWPMGTVDMYEAPRCSNGSNTWQGESYWGQFPGGGGGGRGGVGRGERP